MLDKWYLPSGEHVTMPPAEVHRRRTAVAAVLPIALWAMEQLTDTYKGKESVRISRFFNLENDGEHVWDLSGMDQPPFPGWERPVLEETGEPDPEASDQWVISAEDFTDRWKQTLDVLREAVKSHE